MRSLALAIFLPFLLALGCASPSPEYEPPWWKFPEGKTKADFLADDNECQLLAKGAMPDLPRYDSASLRLILGPGDRDDAIRGLVHDYHSCLEARGYKQGSPPVSTPKVEPPPVATPPTYPDQPQYQ